ncbi:MAG TPA: hypothetical protein VHR37_08260 [Solirubrobacterales bacterium]|jgi:hypothetical protein|nr:hypothetical protein [Solirubrobacterales bacterium]
MPAPHAIFHPTARWVVLVLALSGAAIAFLASTPATKAITLMQGDAPVALSSAAPNDGLGAGVLNADTAGGPAASDGPNTVLLLIAALGVLVGVLVVTRPRRRGPD